MIIPASPRTWIETTVGEVCTIVTGRTPSTSDIANRGDQFPFFKPGDLDTVNGELVEASEWLSVDGLAQSVDLPPATVLVSCIGSLGKSGVTTVQGACNQQINAILPSSAALPWYLYYWSRTIRPWLTDNASATTIAIINKGRFSAAPLPLAPLAEQERIVHKIGRLFTRTRRIRHELSSVADLGGRTPACGLIDRLEAAILARAFRGELVPQDPSDEPASVLLDRIRAQRAAAPKPKRGRRSSAAA